MKLVRIAIALVCSGATGVQGTAAYAQEVPAYENLQPGKDISGLYGTIWLLKQVEGSTQGLSQVVIDIEQTGISFGTPSYSLIVCFQYHLQTGWKFSSQPFTKGGDAKNSTYILDQQVADLFEGALHQSDSYELNKSDLIFFDTDKHPIMVLSALQPKGIEDRKLRIARYRVDDSRRMDKDGLIDATYPAWVLFMNGSVSGTPGAGAWEGTYKLSGDNLEFDAGGAGYAYSGAFTEEQGEQDRLVCAVFKGDLRIEQKGDQILLRDKSGSAQILLVPF
jgi:heat shock protein HslJ